VKKTAAELAGTFAAVLFCPDDLNIIRDGPAARRGDVQPRGVSRAVADELGRDAAHLVGKIVERVEQGRFFMPVAQDGGLLVI